MKKVFYGFGILAVLVLNSIAVAKPKNIVALVNRDSLTVEDLKQKLAQDTALDSDPQLALSQALNAVIIDKLIAQEAAALDFSRDTAFQRQKQEHVIKLVLGKMYQKYVADLISVTLAEAEKHYYDNRETIYKIPEQVKVSHILIEAEQDPNIKDPEKRKNEAEKAALQKAKEIKKRAQTEDFASLARTFSKDYPSAGRGGDMGYQKRGQLLPEIDSAVFAADTGLILGPFQSQHGYHVVKVIEKVQEGYKELDERLKQEIFNRLKVERTSQRNQAFLDSLRAQMAYEFNDPILSLPETTKVDDDRWCVMINKIDTLRAKEAREELLNYSLYSRAGQMSLGDKKDFLRQKSIWVQVKILQLVARELGYFDEPEAKQEENKFALAQAEKKIRQEALPQYDPSPEEILHYFGSHPELFQVEFPLHVYHIIFDDSISAAAVRDSILDGADFVEMARRHYPGQADIKEAAYDLGYISKYEMPEGFYDAADMLETGQVSPPVKTFLGYHLIKLIDRKKDQTVEEVMPQITKTLREEYQKRAQAEWEASLKKGAKIKIFKEVIDGIDPTQLTKQPESGDSTKQ